MPPRDAASLAVTAVLAIGVPIGAAVWVGARTDELAEQLGAAAEVPARIGSVDAGLTGSIRITELALGDLVAAEAIEGSVGMGSLLDGELRADEIRVHGPQVAVHVDPDGDSDLARLARRLVGRRARTPGTGGGPARVRRIVVDGGRLVAHIAGVGELSADGVEVIPDTHGARIVTGPVRLHGARGELALDLAFSRSAAELALPAVRFGRVLAVGGSGTLRAGTEQIALRDLAAGRRVAGGVLEVRAEVDDAGAARRVGVDVSPAAITVFGDRVPLRALARFAPSGLAIADTRASGAVTLRRTPEAGVVALAIDGKLDGLVLAHPNLAAEPVVVSPFVRGELAVTPDAVTLTAGNVALGAVDVDTAGWVRRRGPVSGQVEVHLAPAPCRDLLASVPDPVRGPLDGMALEGTAGGRVKLTVDLAAPAGEGVQLTGALAGGCRVVSEPPGADVSTLAKPSEQRLSDGSRVRIGKGEPGWIDLKRLPWYVPGAFVSAEDGRFYEHPGFDPTQIARSLEIDLREQRLARGGSTISQQLVKNAFLNQRRSLDRKLQEAILTWRLEARLEKPQILERYLNIIELGPRIWGLRAAAKHWFNVSPRELSIRQAAFLAALTSQPTAMTRRVRKHGGLDPESANRVTIILRAMYRDGVLDEAALFAAMGDSMRFAATALPDR